MNRAAIEAKAKTILQEHGAYYLPVPVETVAYHLGLDVRPASLGDDISGLLVIENGQGTIGYNLNHAEVRQRFTIAHELGHYVLHQSAQPLFIDKRYRSGTTYYRDGHAATGVDPHEIEANSFAAALLMPDDLVYAEVAKYDLDLDDEESLSALAKRFKVSTQAMAYRLAKLEVLAEPDF